MARKNEPLRYARQIGEAIVQRCLVQLTYDSERRIVAPYIYGRSVAGNMVLSGYQVRNLSDPDIKPAWRTFDEEGITAFEVLDETFQPRWDYNPRDENFGITVFSVAPNGHEHNA